MRVEALKVKNFRSLKDVKLEIGPHTAIIGGNGVGKSSILKAFERFYSTSRSIDIDEFYNRDSTNPIEIEITFSDINEVEKHQFSSRIRNGKLNVTRVFDLTSTSGRYHGSVMQSPDFKYIREGSSFNERRQRYNDLRTKLEYKDLPIIQSATALDQALEQWENDHPDQLVLMRDDGQFFGFQNASRGALQRYTNFLFIPAVREATVDATDSKSSVTQQLIEIVIRSALSQRSGIKQLQEELNSRYKSIIAPENMPELDKLSKVISNDLQWLYSDAHVGLAWRSALDIQIPLPIADVTLSHDGFPATVDRQGHGLQRAFIFTLLRQLAQLGQQKSEAIQDHSSESIDSRNQENTNVPNLIIGIEEPELYQHPVKQRHLASVLRKLSEGKLPGANEKTQLIFASHSPSFVSMAYVNEIRFTRRVRLEAEGAKVCQLRSLDLDKVAKKLELASNSKIGSFSAESLQARLHIMSNELSEGFFADAVVLVEGRSDKAALIAAAAVMDLDFEASGISVLSAESKNNLDRPFLIFQELGIPVYVIWDCDKSKQEKNSKNLTLLRIADPISDYQIASAETRVSKKFACFEENLETTLKEDITEEIYEKCFNLICAENDIVRQDALKNPKIMKFFLEKAIENGRKSKTLEDIVRAIWKHCKEEVIQH